MLCNASRLEICCGLEVPEWSIVETRVCVLHVVSQSQWDSFNFGFFLEGTVMYIQDIKTFYRFSRFATGYTFVYIY